MDRECIVVVCGHGINDPLVSTLMLNYAVRLQREEPGRPMLFFTEEPGAIAAPPALLAEMEACGIRWHPMKYDIHGHQFLQRMRNMATVCLKGWWFARGAKRRKVVGFLPMAGAYASALRTLGFHWFVLVSFEPHSRYMAELGVWRKDSMKYKVSAWFERRQVRNADVVVAPTQAAVDLVAQSGSAARVVHQGVTVDVPANARREDRRLALRSALGLDGRVVLAYAGKFNGLYYSEADYVRFMETTCGMDERVHHLVVTFPEHGGLIKEGIDKAGLAGRCTVLDPVPPAELTDYLSASDIGVIAVPPTPSQAFRTPVKSALYWAAGLPIIVPAGISDDWRIARDRQVGLVLPDLMQVEAGAFRALLDEVSGSGAAALRQRCVDAAMAFRDTGLMVEVLREALAEDQSGFTPKGRAASDR
ncbi:MAG TPA: hypothetical protein PKD45_01265 [Flavobacteriales bacterium]|nr:hypothetical protein [Flavobacteriales bacterium]